MVYKTFSFLNYIWGNIYHKLSGTNDKQARCTTHEYVMIIPRRLVSIVLFFINIDVVGKCFLHLRHGYTLVYNKPTIIVKKWNIYNTLIIKWLW